MALASERKCTSCGGYEFSVSDGFMYCTICGSLFENFEELEIDDDTNKFLGKARIKIKKKNSTKSKLISQNLKADEKIKEGLSQRSDFFTKQTRTLGSNEEHSSPDYLYALGVRLEVFSHILVRSSQILVDNMHFPPDFLDTSFAVFQRYLIHCRVAFCEEETSNSPDDAFTTVLENKEFHQQEQTRIERKMNETKGKAINILSQSTSAWNFLTQANLDEDLEFNEPVSDDEMELGDVGNVTSNPNMTKVIRNVETGLSKDAVIRASRLRLNMEILISILFTAALCSGVRNIYISDFVRWIRQGHFLISQRELGLIKRSGHEKFLPHMNQGVKVEIFDGFGLTMKFPLYEIDKQCLLFNQSLDLSKNMEVCSFPKLAARLIDNLELPTDLLKSVILLESIVPCDLSPYSRRQYDCDYGYNMQELVEMKTESEYHQFSQCFGRTEISRNDTAKTHWDEQVSLSNETKVMAYILFALKLSIDLDKQKMKKYEAEQVEFDIDAWIHQLEMRIKCMEGHDMGMVTRSTCPIPSMFLKFPFAENCTGISLNEKLVILYRARQQGFRACLPHEMNFHLTYNLPTVFKTRRQEMQESRIRNESVFSPLKFQKKMLKQLMDNSPENFENSSKESIKTFLKSFSKCKISDEGDNFHSIFPASKCYKRYPTPMWCSLCVARRHDTLSKDMDYRVYISLRLCDELYASSSSSFSKRFDFLLKSFAYIIGEDVTVLYCAFKMLETNLIDAERIQEVHDNIINGSMMELKIATHKKMEDDLMGTLKICTQKMDSIDEFRFIRFNDVMVLKNENDGFENIVDEENQDTELDSYASYLASNFQTRNEKRSIINRPQLITRRYDFDTIFALLTVKYW